jgi:hypothetical protein
LFENSKHVNKFQKYMNSRHRNMNFTKEIEKDSCISFLDIWISRKQGVDSFFTSIYRKPTFSGIYLNFRSYAPMIYKKGLINCLLYRIFHLCSNWALIHEEINNLKCILLFNKYSSTLINDCIQKILNNIFSPNPRRNLYLYLEKKLP